MKSFRTPFQVVGGKIADTSDPRKIVEQKIIDVLVTQNMERPMLPDYGMGVQSLVFEAIDELEAADFRTDASLEVASRVTGVSIVDVKVDLVDETEAHVTVYYRTPLSSVQETSFSLFTGPINEETPL